MQQHTVNSRVIQMLISMRSRAGAQKEERTNAGSHNGMGDAATQSGRLCWEGANKCGTVTNLECSNPQAMRCIHKMLGAHTHTLTMHMRVNLEMRVWKSGMTAFSGASLSYHARQAASLRVTLSGRSRSASVALRATTSSQTLSGIHSCSPDMLCWFSCHANGPPNCSCGKRHLSNQANGEAQRHLATCFIPTMSSQLVHHSYAIECKTACTERGRRLCEHAQS